MKYIYQWIILFLILNNCLIHGAHINNRGDVIRQRAKSNRRQMVKNQIERILQRNDSFNTNLRRNSFNTSSNSSIFLKTLKKQFDSPSAFLQTSPLLLFHSSEQSDLTQKLQGIFPLCKGEFSWEKIHFQLPENDNGYQRIASGVLNLYFEKQQRSVADPLTIEVYWIKSNDDDNSTVLLDSKNVSSAISTWITFDIIPGLSPTHEEDNNYTLSVVVRDQLGYLLPASRWLSPMNCSDWSTIPIPKSILNTREEFYPQLDVLTLEVLPSKDSLMHFPILDQGAQSGHDESTLSKIEDISFTENDPNLMLHRAGSTGSNLQPAFQPVNKKIIRNREEFRDALADLMVVNLNQNLTSELLGVFEDQILKKRVSMKSMS